LLQHAERNTLRAKLFSRLW